MTRGSNMETQGRKLRGTGSTVDKSAGGVQDGETRGRKDAEQRIRVTVIGHVSRRTLVSRSLREDALILQRRGHRQDTIANMLGVDVRTVRRWLG